jgi:hypothetical protein
MLSDDPLEDFGEHDCPFSVSARAVTGEDGRLLVDDVDISALHSKTIPSRKEKDPKERAESNCYHGYCSLPPLQPRKVRNTVTGHVFDWSPAFTLSKNDDLEVTEWYGR